MFLSYMPKRRKINKYYKQTNIYMFYFQDDRYEKSKSL